MTEEGAYAATIDVYRCQPQLSGDGCGRGWTREEEEEGW